MNFTVIGSEQGTSRCASSCTRPWSRRLAIFASAALVTGIFAAAPGAAAQPVAQFSYAETVVANDVSRPTRVAVDGSGNVYIPDTANNQVLKETPNSRSYAQSVVATGLGQPFGVAVDRNDSVYISDHGDGRVLKETLNGSSYIQTVVATGLSQPAGAAVDGNGNVYIADYGDGRVLKETLNGSSYIQTVVATGTIAPVSVAVDGSDNIYVADSRNKQVLKETPSGGAYTQSVVATGLISPQGVAVDGSRNVYIVDSGNNHVLKETPSGSTYTQSVIATILGEPLGVAVDTGGNLYVSEYFGAGVLKLQTSGVNFGAEPVGTSSTGPALTFTINSAVTLGAPQALTMGAPGLDFAVAGGTCTSGASFSAGTTCTVLTTFTPKFAGTRKGAVELVNSAGAVIATAYVYGTGTGPQVAFDMNSATANVVAELAGDFTQLYGAAVDGAGNLYATAVDSGMQSVALEIPAGCTSESCVKTLGGGYSELEGVAVDGAGNVYVTDAAINAVKRIPLGCTSANCVETLGGGFNDPFDLAVDGSGNVYVADTINRAVKEIPAGCISGANNASCVRTLGGGFNQTFGVAVDGSGNLYVADPLNQAIKEIPASCIAGINNASCVETLGGGFNAPSGVAVDGAGNVYTTDATGLTAVVKEIPAGCASASCVKTLGSSFEGLSGVAVDGNGNVFVSDSVNTAVDEITRATAPALSFALTNAGSQSSDSPQTVTIENIGNQPLTFPIPTTGTNPAIAQNFAYDSTSTCTQTDTSSAAAFTLAPGTSCSLGVDFIPTSAGSLSGQAQLTNNNLNAPAPGYAEQSIALSGTAEQIVLSPAAGPLPAATVGTAYSQALTATGGASPYTFTATGVPAGLTLSTTGALSGTPTTDGSFSIAVTVADANYLTETATYTLTVNKAAPVAPPDFSLTSGGAQSQTVSPGGKATFSFNVSPIGGSYPSNVTFTAAGLPTGAAASFSPSTIAANGGPQNVSLTIQTATAGTAMNNEPGSPFGGTPLAFCFLLFPLLGVRKARKQLLRHGGMLLLLIVVGTAGMASLSGCGSSGSSGGSHSQPAKDYTVTVTAASGSAAHSFNVSLNLQ